MKVMREVRQGTTLCRSVMVAATLLVWAGGVPGPLQGQDQSIAEARYELVVSISGAHVEHGQFRVALFNQRDAFVEEPFQTAVLAARIDGVEWRVMLPRGHYALAAFHDVDENGELNTNFVGMPRERYAFSRDARGRFGPPSWDDASFEVTTTVVEQELVVR